MYVVVSKFAKPLRMRPCDHHKNHADSCTLSHTLPSGNGKRLLTSLSRALCHWPSNANCQPKCSYFLAGLPMLTLNHFRASNLLRQQRRPINTWGRPSHLRVSHLNAPDAPFDTNLSDNASVNFMYVGAGYPRMTCWVLLR